MKPSSRTSASICHLPSSARPVELLLFALLAFGLFLSLPAYQAGTPQLIQHDRVERLIAVAPFIATAYDLRQTMRGEPGSPTDDDSGAPWPVFLLPDDILQPALSTASNLLPAVPGRKSLRVSTLPGSPRGPPALPH